jgi:hypothetical protein
VVYYPFFIIMLMPLTSAHQDCVRTYSASLGRLCVGSILLGE